MKRVYSGYWDCEQKKRTKPRLGRVQRTSIMVPIVLVFGVYILYMLLYRNQGAEDDIAVPGGDVKVYYAMQIENGSYGMGFAEIDFPPGDSAVSIFQNAFSKPPKSGGYIAVIEDGVGINKIITYGDTVEIDFSAPPVNPDVDANEAEIRLRAIANTLYVYYDVKTVIITVEGEILMNIENMYDLPLTQ